MKNQNKKIAEIFKSETSEIVHGIHVSYLTHDDSPDWRFSLDFIAEFTRLVKTFHGVDICFTGHAYPGPKAISKHYELMFSSSRQLEKTEVQQCFEFMELEYLVIEYSSVTFVEDYMNEECEVLRRNYDLSYQELYQFTDEEMADIFTDEEVIKLFSK